jgi:hypothetical protein
MSSNSHWYKDGVGFARRYFSWMVKNTEKTNKKINHFFTSEYRANLTFSGLEVEPKGILLFSYMCWLISFFCIFIVDLFIILAYGASIFSIDAFTIILMVSITFFLPYLVLNLVANYPSIYARYAKIHSLGDIPEILSYLVMYLKLIPNLENSVKFAASESSTSLSYDLRKMLWDMEIRIYHGIEDALTTFANQWGEWSDYFKRSLHLVRSSVHEREEAARALTLNRSLDVVLDGTRDLMNQFANKLHQPTMIIYSIGIMIPLSLVAMLPAAGLIGVKITIFQVFILYDIILPICVFLYTRKILLSRPATFNPPTIPTNHPDLIKVKKKRCFIFSVFIGSLIALPGCIFLLLPTLISSNSSQSFLLLVNGINTFNTYVPVTLFILWGFTSSVTLYCIIVYRPYKKVRDNIKQIEKEFSDALYILGKRISEEKSPEESFMYTAHTMSGAHIAEIFRQTGFNLTAMHTSVKEALFNPQFGSLIYVYSDRIKAIMHLFVEGIQKSQKAVSLSIIKIADHLKELQAVENKIRESLYSLTSTLRSTAAIFAPMIAGVTLAITKLVSNILSSMKGTTSSEIISESSLLSTMTTAFTLENVRPEFFVLVIGIYVIELVILLTRFTNGIDEGDDKAELMYSLGKILPTAIVVLTFTVIIGQFLFSSIVKPL